MGDRGNIRRLTTPSLNPEDARTAANRRRIGNVRAAVNELVFELYELLENPLGEHADFVSKPSPLARLFTRVSEIVPGIFFQENALTGLIRVLICSKHGQILLTHDVNQTPASVNISVYGSSPEVLGGLVLEHLTKAIPSFEHLGFKLTMR